MAMPRDAAARHEQVVTTLTILHLRTDLLRRQLIRHTDLSAADRQWLESSLGEITDTIRVLTALMGARGGVLEASRSDILDVVASRRFGRPQRELNAPH
jgi:hypothetical protein